VSDVPEILLVESGIRQLYARCIDAVWRKNSGEFAGCFAEDGEWKIAGLHMRGREEIDEGFKKLLSPNERVLMIPSLPVLDIGEGTVSGRTYVTELVKKKDNQGLRTIGTYFERFVQQGERWLFQWRHFALHYYGPPDLSAPFYDHPDFGSPPNMPADQDPTVIRRAD